VPIKCPKCHTNNPETLKFCGECGTRLDLPQTPQISATRTLETTPDELGRGSLFAGRYEIIEELGTGGMGRIYRAFDKKIDEEVALKLIKPEIAAERKVLERFRNELRIARKISHPNVCRMHDLNEEGKTLYITMEYVAGEDLKSVIHRMGILAAGKAVFIARQVAEGLSQAHKLGVVHRDLKPGNIMIDKEGNAKIMDFGIARTLTAAGTTAEGAIIGTPEYMSPEQVEGKEADQRSDIYSLGIILFEMLTGRAPFEGETPFSIANKHKTEPPPNPRTLNPQIPAELSRVILRSLEKTKEKRYQTAEELIADLAAVEESLPTAERVAPKRKTITHREVTVKFQPRKFVIPVVALVVIAAAALLFLKPLLRKKATVAPKIENSIAVISFENLTGSPAYNDLIKAVPSLFITKFETMGFSYVATLERLRDLQKQMGKDPSAPIDPDTGFAACQREGIGAMVVGRITKAGNIFAIDVQVIDVATKKALASATSRGEGESSILLAQVDDLAGQIIQRLGRGALKTEAAQPISEVTTSSMEAYNYYLKGLEAFDRSYLTEARQYLLTAVEIDPAFAMAYRFLARTYSYLGLRKDMKEAGQKAMSLADRTTPKEKLYIQATYARLVEDDLEKRLRLAKHLVEKYPKDKEARWELGSSYLQLQLTDEAIRQYQAAVDLDPNYTPALNNLASMYATKGDLGKALEYAKRQVEVAPNEPNPLDGLGVIYTLMGQLDLAIEHFIKALSIKPDFYWSLRQISYVYGLKENYSEAIRWANEYAARSTVDSYKAEGYQLKAFYEYWTGSFQKALEDADMSRVVGDETQDPSVSIWSLWLKGSIYLDQKKFNLSKDVFNQGCDVAIKVSPPFAHLNSAGNELTMGWIEIEAGNIEAARKRLLILNHLLLENKKPDPGKYIEECQKTLSGKLLIVDGSFADAISILEGLRTFEFAGFDPETIYNGNLYQRETDIARAYEMKGDIDKAIGVLERRTHFNAATKDFRLTPPKFYYNLGRLYEKKSNNAKARANYAKFLDLWKDADPGLPEVEDAKKRLAGLNG